MTTGVTGLRAFFMDPQKGPVCSIPDIGERVILCTPGKRPRCPGIAQFPEDLCYPGPDPVVRIVEAAGEGEGCTPVLQPPECGYGPGPHAGVGIGKGADKARDCTVIVQPAQCNDDVGADPAVRIGEQPEQGLDGCRCAGFTQPQNGVAPGLEYR